MNNTRQIYFASVGGYDLHAGQVALDSTSTGPHANLFRELSQSMWTFQRAMEHLGLADQVITFTMSDFGRTSPRTTTTPSSLAPTMAGAITSSSWAAPATARSLINGRKMYGPYPVLTINGPDDHSTGRWIPKFSVDQYAGHLAHWFGVTNTDLHTVFPNLSRFAFDLDNGGGDGLNFINTFIGAGVARPPTRAPFIPRG